MSKASEWAARMAEQPRHQLTPDLDAEVMREGVGLWLIVKKPVNGLVGFDGQQASRIFANMTPGIIGVRQDEALAFARWILDTFGEASVSEPPRA